MRSKNMLQVEPVIKPYARYFLGTRKNVIMPSTLSFLNWYDEQQRPYLTQEEITELFNEVVIKYNLNLHFIEHGFDSEKILDEFISYSTNINCDVMRVSILALPAMLCSGDEIDDYVISYMARELDTFIDNEVDLVNECVSVVAECNCFAIIQEWYKTGVIQSGRNVYYDEVVDNYFGYIPKQREDVEFSIDDWEPSEDVDLVASLLKGVFSTLGF